MAKNDKYFKFVDSDDYERVIGAKNKYEAVGYYIMRFTPVLPENEIITEEVSINSLDLEDTYMVSDDDYIETNLTSKRIEEIMKLEAERIKPESQAAALRKRLEIKDN